MLNRSSVKEQIRPSGFQAGIQPTVEDLNEDVKEEPSSPFDCENEMGCADVDGEDDANVKKFALSKRRTAHTVAEQKRRDAIKKGYDDLQTIVPACASDDSPGAPKMSKAVILQKTIDHLKNILEDKQEQEKELDALKKEVLALKIMKTNYEQIARSTQVQASLSAGSCVSDEVKFNVFKYIMESQFRTFNEAAHMASFETLSASIFNWLEEECKPQKLQEIVVDSLRNTNIHGI